MDYAVLLNDIQELGIISRVGQENGPLEGEGRKYPFQLKHGKRVAWNLGGDSQRWNQDSNSNRGNLCRKISFTQRHPAFGRGLIT